MTPPDAPPIARLRVLIDDNTSCSDSAECRVQLGDVRYALARVDETCAGCMVIEAVKDQGQNIDRLYAIIDELMAEKRTKSETPR